MACNDVGSLPTAAIGAAREIRYLSVFGTSLADADEALRFLAALPELRRVRLGGTPMAPDPAAVTRLVPAVVRHAPSVCLLDDCIVQRVVKRGTRGGRKRAARHALRLSMLEGETRGLARNEGWRWLVCIICMSPAAG